MGVSVVTKQFTRNNHMFPFFSILPFKFPIAMPYFLYNKNDNIHKNEVQNIGFGIPINFQNFEEKKNY